MTTEAGKLVAELLAQRLGLRADVAPTTLDHDSLVAAVAISLIKGSHLDEDTADTRLQRIAAIVGACPRCFGSNFGCVRCGGEGAPGYEAPEREALVQWISAPLHRLGLSIVERRSAAAGQPLFGEFNHE